MRIFSLRSWRRRLPNHSQTQVPGSPQIARVNRISTLSNAATLYEPSPLPASLLGNFPVPPSAVSPLPIQSNNPFFPQIQQQSAAYPHTFLPNISQSSLDTLADPLARHPAAPNRLSTFEAFLASARQQEVQRMERERRMALAYQKAEEERRRQEAIRSRHGDDYRGGFGSSSGRGTWRMQDAGSRGGYRPGMPHENTFVGLGIGGVPSPPVITVERPSLEREIERLRTSGNGVKAAKVWLKKVTSLDNLRGRAAA